MKIFITREIPGGIAEKLNEAGHEVVMNNLGRALTPEELIEKLKGGNFDIILSLLTDKIDGEVMDLAGPQLKLVANYAVGFDNINIKDATDRQILVSNTPSDKVNEAVAEHSMALALSLVRRVVEADEAVKRGAYHGWDPNIFLGEDVGGKILGIIGLGRIGTMVAKIAKGLGLTVLYHKHESDTKAEEELGIKFSTLPDLLKNADIISLHTPLNDETRHMVNKDFLSQMKDGAYLVNTARGGIVNEGDLVEALRNGKLGGVALDVFEIEPNINPELIGMENVILTPHIASATHGAREDMSNLCFTAIAGLTGTTKPSNLVNPEVWESRRK